MLTDSGLRGLFARRLVRLIFTPENTRTATDVTGKDVVLVDFSYKRPVLMEMAEKANNILILDHHKTSAEDLVDLPANVTEKVRHEPQRRDDDVEHFSLAKPASAPVRH